MMVGLRIVIVLALVLCFSLLADAFVVRPSAIRAPWTPTAFSSSLASSVEANGFLLQESDVKLPPGQPPITTGLDQEEEIVCPDYLLIEETEELAQFDLSESSAAGGIGLEHPSLNLARALALAASAVYGTNFAVVKMLDEQIPFAVSATLRFGLAAAVVSALVLNGERSGAPSAANAEERGPATWAGMEIGGWYCLGYLCQAVGLQTADASKSAFFNALAVIVVPLLDSFFRGKQMGAKGMSSIGLAILGVGTLQLGPSILTGKPLVLAQGDAFCLGQAALFGIGYWRLEQTSSQYASQAGRITMGQLLGVALGSTVFCGLSSDLPTLSQLQGWLTNEFTLGALVWTALVSTALALYLETVALKAISASELTVLMTSVSLFGSAFAFVTMGETMSPIGMAGGLLILAGCVFSSLGGEEEAPMLLEPEEGILNQELILLESLDEPQVEEVVPSYVPIFANATLAGL